MFKIIYKVTAEIDKKGICHLRLQLLSFSELSVGVLNEIGSALFLNSERKMKVTISIMQMVKRIHSRFALTQNFCSKNATGLNIVLTMSLLLRQNSCSLLD